VGEGKSGTLENKSSNISETRKDRGNVTNYGRPIETHQRSFKRYHLRPTASSYIFLLLSECTSERIFTIIEVGIFQNCDLVSDFHVPAFSIPAIWSVIFQVLQIQRCKLCIIFI